MTNNRLSTVALLAIVLLLVIFNPALAQDNACQNEGAAENNPNCQDQSIETEEDEVNVDDSVNSDTNTEEQPAETEQAVATEVVCHGAHCSETDEPCIAVGTCGGGDGSSANEPKCNDHANPNGEPDKCPTEAPATETVVPEETDEVPNSEETEEATETESAPTEDNGEKVKLCHATGSETNPFNIIEVSVNSYQYNAHVSHGDELAVDGKCDEPQETETVEPTVTETVTATASPTPEETAEVTPETTPEATAEVTPEITPEVTPETTPEVCLEGTAWNEETQECETDVCPNIDGPQAEMPEGYQLDDEDNCVNPPEGKASLEGRVYLCVPNTGLPAATVRVYNDDYDKTETVGDWGNWGAFNLDADEDGTEYHIDVIFSESGYTQGSVWGNTTVTVYPGDSIKDLNYCFVIAEDPEYEFEFPPFPDTFGPEDCDQNWQWPGAEPYNEGFGCDETNWQDDDDDPSVSYGAQTFCPANGGQAIGTYWIDAPQEFWGTEMAIEQGFEFIEDWLGHGPRWWKNVLLDIQCGEVEYEFEFPPFPDQDDMTNCEQNWQWPDGSEDGYQDGWGCDAVNWQEDDDDPNVDYGSQTFCPQVAGLGPVYTYWIRAPYDFWGTQMALDQGFTFTEDWLGHGPHWWKNVESGPAVDCYQEPTEEPTEPPTEPTPTPTEPGNPGGGGGDGGDKKTLCEELADPNYGMEGECISATQGANDNSRQCINPPERMVTDDKGKAVDANRESDINSYIVDDETGEANVSFEAELTATLSGDYSNPDPEDCMWAGNVERDEDGDGEDELFVEVHSYPYGLITTIWNAQDPAFCSNGECVIVRNINTGELEVYNLDGERLENIDLNVQGRNPHAEGEYIVYTNEAGELAFVSEDGETQCTSGFGGDRGTLLSDLSGFTARGDDTVSRIFEVENFDASAEAPIAEEVVAVGGPNMIALDPDLSGHVAVNEVDTLEVLQSLSDETAEVFDGETRTRKVAWNDPEGHVASEAEKATFTEWCEEQPDSETAKNKSAESSAEETIIWVAPAGTNMGDYLLNEFHDEGILQAHLWTNEDNLFDDCLIPRQVMAGQQYTIPAKCVRDFISEHVSLN